MAQVTGIFILDVWTPLGVAVWLLYFIPIWYAMRYLRRGRLTLLTVSVAAAVVTGMILLGWFVSPRGMDSKVALINRLFGVVLLWFVAMFVAWLTKRNQALRETDRVLRETLHEKEVRLRQALEAAEMATWEWDLRTGAIQVGRAA